ncbi:hypothetical protein QQS21_011902 [Conoideocrella luteorostrata]|uniref:Uncharacterized protein n=1 Tax=Conoideocrella luteorostrata TaxID=1105319 RepID=A0AAJ0FVD8_9HYPO|nr:hypothetical protein QQS21_011902 [Conoideocrella luteorostrata]
MTFFQNKSEQLSPWQLLWTLIWPNDSWLRLVTEKGLVPVLFGVDILVLSDKETSHEDMCDGEGYQLVLGLAVNPGAKHTSIQDTLDSNFFEEFKASLHPTYKFNEERSEIKIKDKNITLYIGLHEGEPWPYRLEDPVAFLANWGGFCSAAIYYNDKEQEVYQFTEKSETLFKLDDNRGFVIILEGPCKDTAWSCVKPETT